MPQERAISERKKQYLEKLRDPRWQKMRLKIFERDEWACQICFDTETTLNVHHRFYEQGKEPWEYPGEALITLCEECHREETENRYAEEKALLQTLKKHFFSADLNSLVIGFGLMKPQHLPEVISSCLEWVLQDEDAQQQLLEMYFNHLSAKRKTWHLEADERYKQKCSGSAPVASC